MPFTDREFELKNRWRMSTNPLPRWASLEWHEHKSGIYNRYTEILCNQGAWLITAIYERKDGTYRVYLYDREAYVAARKGGNPNHDYNKRKEFDGLDMVEAACLLIMRHPSPFEITPIKELVNQWQSQH